MKTFAAMLLTALLSGSAAWVLTDQRVEQPQRSDDGWVFASIAPSAVEASPAPEAASARTDEKAAGAASRETGTSAADRGADAR